MAQAGDNQPVQLQLELTNSALLGKDILGRFLKVCMEDDVQPMITVAMESIGDELWVSRARIEEARRIFFESVKKPGFWPSRQLLQKQVGLVAGVAMHGWPESISKSIGLTKTFLLVTACQTCFTDDEIARTLHEIMWLSNKNPQFNVEHNMRFINAISGYCHRLVPFECYNKVVCLITGKLSSPDEMVTLFERFDPSSLAEVLVELFTAMQDVDITRITLEGARGGCFLTATLQWLLEGDVQCLLGDSWLFGPNESRLRIRLVDRVDHAGRPTWYVGRWKVEDELKPIIEVQDKSPMSIKGFTSNSHTSLQTAKSQISAQCGLQEKFAEATGILAGAIVMVAYETGRLLSQNGSSAVFLKDICAASFTSSHSAIMHKYGWPNDDTTPAAFLEAQKKVASALEAWITRAASGQSPLYQEEATAGDILRRALFDCNVDFYDQNHEPLVLEKVDDCDKVLDPAIYLAGDALLTCFERVNPARRFKALDGSGVEKHAEILIKLIFPPGIVYSVEDGCFFSKFWLAALTGSVPGYSTANRRDLAIAQCGYVAYAKVLESISMDARDACAIAIVPGTLRRYDESRRVQGRATRLVEITAGLPSFREIPGKDMSVKCFDQSNQYIGIRLREDPANAGIIHLVDKTIETPTFRITSELKLSYKPPRGNTLAIVLTNQTQEEFRCAPISWTDSIEAVAFAQHISVATAASISPGVERDLAKTWRAQGFYDQMAWHQVGKNAIPGKNCIAMTASSNELRFFEAGYLSHGCKLFIRHDECSLVACLDAAVQYGTFHGASWAIIV